MSIKNLYTVRDLVSEYFHPPFVARNDEEAKRMVSMSLRGDRDSMIAAHPSDYSLMRCGAFDDSTGTVHSSGFEFICHLTELAPQPAAQA